MKTKSPKITNSRKLKMSQTSYNHKKKITKCFKINCFTLFFPYISGYISFIISSRGNEFGDIFNIENGTIT